MLRRVLSIIGKVLANGDSEQNRKCFYTAQQHVVNNCAAAFSINIEQLPRVTVDSTCTIDEQSTIEDYEQQQQQQQQEEQQQQQQQQEQQQQQQQQQNNKGREFESTVSDVHFSSAESAVVASKAHLTLPLEQLLQLPVMTNRLYPPAEVLTKLRRFSELKIRLNGHYYLHSRWLANEKPMVYHNRKGHVTVFHKEEQLNPVEKVISSFCEEAMRMSRVNSLALQTQTERHLVWVGKHSARFICSRLNGNGKYMVSRYPNDILLKDKQCMSVTLKHYMLTICNCCELCKKEIENSSRTHMQPMKPRLRQEAVKPHSICRHMVQKMVVDVGCGVGGCGNSAHPQCIHQEIFIPEICTFSTYNELQRFRNRMTDDLLGQIFVCKPAYLHQGAGFRFFRHPAEFEQFYHMTVGKETSRHNFLVQRVIDKPLLYYGRKFDVRSFLLIITLKFRRVVSFVHYGYCHLASLHFNLHDDVGGMRQLYNDTQMIVCSFMTDEEKTYWAEQFSRRELHESQFDRTRYFQEIFDSMQLPVVKNQIFLIATKLTEAIEGRIKNFLGCFQLLGIDMCVDANLKVWLLEVNSSAFSSLDMLSLPQRQVVPAALMEAVGLVMECMYKSTHHLPLNSSCDGAEPDFVFRRNFDFVFCTSKSQQVNARVFKAKKLQLPVCHRLALVDAQRQEAKERERLHQRNIERMRVANQKVREQRQRKGEEES